MQKSANDPNNLLSSKRLLHEHDELTKDRARPLEVVEVTDPLDMHRIHIADCRYLPVSLLLVGRGLKRLVGHQLAAVYLGCCDDDEVVLVHATPVTVFLNLKESLESHGLQQYDLGDG